MSLFKVFGVVCLAAVFLIAGCKQEPVKVESGVKKKRETKLMEVTNTEAGELDLSNIDP